MDSSWSTSPSGTAGKVFGTETLDLVAQESLQVLGGYGFASDYPVERHYRDSRINLIFEGTNEVNRLIIPATLVKRMMQGRLPYLEFLQQVEQEIANPGRRPRRGDGPLAVEMHATEMAKRMVAYVVRVLTERDLASRSPTSSSPRQTLASPASHAA